MKKRKNVIYRPSKGVCIFGGVIGILFVIIGLTTIVPRGGLFGIIWTVMAAGIGIYYFYMAFGKGTVGTFVMEEEEIESQEDSPALAQKEDASARLEELRRLYDQRLITPEEYEAKREEILKEL